MNAELRLLAARRARLVADAMEQRRMLFDEFARWETPLRVAERALVRVAWVREHLRWVIAASFAIAASPTLRGWLLRGWHLWRAVRQSSLHQEQ